MGRVNAPGEHSRAAGKAATDKDARVLVTGASGFVGAYVLHRLHALAREIVTIAGRDVTSRRVAALAPDVVIHLAAMTHPDECELEPARARQSNVELTRELADGARETCRRFVYASTDLVFDGGRGAYSEEDSPRPVCVYGKSKLAGEAAASGVLGERATVARLSLLYGVRIGSSSRPSFAETMIRRARSGGSVPLYRDQWRTPLYVEDAAESLVRLALLPVAASVPLVHLGGAQKCSRYEMGRTAFEVFGLPLDLARATRMSDHPSPAPRPVDVSLDTKKARGMGLLARSLREGFESFRDRMELP